MACDRCNSIFHFWLSFALLPPPLLPAKKNQNSKKKKIEKPWRYHHFTHVSKKISSDVQFLRYGARQAERDRQMDGQMDRQTDEWMDGQTEKVTYRGGYPTSKCTLSYVLILIMMSLIW